MEKEELITLMKNYKVNNSKMRLRIIDKERLEKEYKQINEDIHITSIYGINNDIRSKNLTTDKVANKVVRDEEIKKEIKQRIDALECEIEELHKQVEQVDIRLECLYENHKKLVEAYYIEGKTADDIGDRLFLELFRRTCSVNGVYKILNRCLNIMCAL